MLSLNPLMDALGVLRNLHSDMTLAQAHVFFVVAETDGLTQRQVVDRTGLSDAAVSRIMALMSKFGSRNTAGLELISMDSDPNDGRYRVIHLTAKGKRAKEQIQKLLGGYRGSTKER